LDELRVALREPGDLESARAAVTKASEISPENPGIFAIRGFVHLLEGSPDAASRDFQRVPQEWLRLRWTAVVNHELGQAKESDAALDALVAGYGSQMPFEIAEVHAWRGERDLAFEWLQRAYDARSISMMLIKSAPLLRKLRDDPRYVALLKKMNFPMD